MFKAGDVVYPTIDSNERYVVSNHRKRCVFKVVRSYERESLVEITDSSEKEIISSTYTIDNNYLTKENTYKINTMGISVGTKVKHKHYPGTIFEVMGADSGESLIFYLEGTFSAEVADEFWVNTHDLTSLPTPAKYPSPPSDRGYLVVGMPAKQIPNKVVVVDDYYDEVETQVRELEKQHKATAIDEDLPETYDWSLNAKRKKKSFVNMKSQEGRIVNEQVRPKYIEELEAYHRELRGK